ncbi:PIN domain-containing protein [Cyanobium sp. N.Huapi 1H5]|uniref:PIN domain-containing protein n=1 Tax=Cyanobium sp. N.Huapi 1H5 TaxID=2823719 RepID=UPI0020CE8FB9|nr:PIN domain-containing protein [Cyanobium sp. N.Huapi 1H5]MCP9837252.1 PIN domain-containing protein [Cyanobium sp. N.Huapi 1H5]
MRSALDTNVLVYAEGFGDQVRVEASRSLLAALADGDVVIPLQCLGELFRVLTGKAGRSPGEARDAVLSWMDAFSVADSTAKALAGAMDLCVDHQLGSWDALVLSVAADAGARLLISEDLNPGFTWRGVRVVNPFATTLDPLLLQLARDGQKDSSVWPAKRPA